jgi:hypothetical protein
MFSRHVLKILFELHDFSEKFGLLKFVMLSEAILNGANVIDKLGGHNLIVLFDNIVGLFESLVL